MKLSKIITFVFMCIFTFSGTILLSSGANNLSVREYTSNSLTLTWTEDDFLIQSEIVDNQKFSSISFNSCSYPQVAQKPAIPFKQYTIAIPEGADVEWNVSGITTREVYDVLPIPVMFPEKDKKGIPIYKATIDHQDYNFKPDNPITVSEPTYFRDAPVLLVKFFPISYDHASGKLVLITKATINFVFKNARLSVSGYTKRAKLDALYAEKILNFDQGKSWITQKPRTLAKQKLNFQNPWYKILVEKDGLYKISRSTLASAGIDVGSMDPRTLKLYNNGGLPLALRTGATENNPTGPVENAIIVSGEDDAVFDEGDYILFYGTELGGWNSGVSNGDFTYRQHPYDTKNYYWLTYGGDPGKRMELESTPATGAGYTETHFVERRHFEEDRYNLLASGLDWYGHRFYGVSANTSFSYDLNYAGSNMAPGRMFAKFKSGNGIRYSDNDSYVYYFDVFLNQQPVLLNKRLNRAVSATYESSFVAENIFTSGSNNISIEYTANSQDCNAYLDWIEFYYPVGFTAVNNYLPFYTNTLGSITKFDIGGFTAQDVILFDITNPISVKKLETNTTVQNEVYSFNLDLTGNRHKRLIATSLSSSQITNITNLSVYLPKRNLLDPLIASDLLIITHPSFEGYAEEIVSLRNSGKDPLSGVVVNTSDIYFFFSSGVQDATAIRNFIRYAYNNWSNPGISYVMLFGDGHYDYRNIALPDTNRVPPFEITADDEINSRNTDNFYVDVNFNQSGFSSITPDLAIGRLPMESHLDASRMLQKLKSYEYERDRDGWQTVITFVADDEVTSSSKSEWVHQRQTDSLTRLPELQKFIIKKIYLSAYSSIPGGFERVKPEANQAIIDQVNEGTLLINYVGHGSPEEWAHEDVLNMTRDLKRIQNEGRLPLWIAATCDFGKYDDPRETSFSEALIWEENTGGIAVFSSSRLVYASSNFALNKRFMENLFPLGQPSRRLGEAALLAIESGTNDQKYHLFGDPTMYLADPREHIEITSVTPDTLKALSRASVAGAVTGQLDGPVLDSFSGGAIMIANDARFDSVNTGGGLYYNVLGPRIFKGEISVNNGQFTGEFIIPKSIRYNDKNTGRVTLFAWDDETGVEALGHVDNLLLNGTIGNVSDSDGPEIDIYFKNQEDFNSGDLIPQNVTLIAEIGDENGINLTEEVGHTIEVKLNDEQPLNVTAFFAYNRDSYAEGELKYYLENLPSGEHVITLQAWDNLNNPSRQSITFRVSESSELVLRDVVNYPNPFANETNFTFQAQPASVGSLVEVEIKIYTVSGRLIKTLDGLYLNQPGFNYYPWDGRDVDGDEIANGVYIYKVTLKEGDTSTEVIEKLVVLK